MGRRAGTFERITGPDGREHWVPAPEPERWRPPRRPRSRIRSSARRVVFWCLLVVTGATLWAMFGPVTERGGLVDTGFVARTLSVPSSGLVSSVRVVGPVANPTPLACLPLGLIPTTTVTVTARLGR